jgi:hypothetical protein
LIIQLNPTLPMLTPKGPALAHFLIDYGEEHHLMWVCIQDNSGEIWTWPNTQVRSQTNHSFGRPKIPNTVSGFMHGTETNSTTNGDMDRQC